MADAVDILLQISILLLLGTLFSLLAKRARIPEILFLVALGFGLQQFSVKVHPFLDLPIIFISTLGLLTLSLVVFEGSAHIKLHTLDVLSMRTLRLVGASALLHITFLTGAAWLLGFALQQSALLAAIVAGTSAPIILTLLENAGGKIVDLLRLESLINTPVNAILPFLVIDFFSFSGESIVAAHLKPFLLKIFVGIGAGVIAGLILFKLFHKVYSRIYSPLAVLIASLATYALTEALGGNGVLGVMSLGLLFGNLYIKERGRMMEAESVFARSVYILLLVLFGAMLSFPLALSFVFKIVVLLATYYLARYLAISISLAKITGREKWFMTLMSPNGVTAIAVAVALAGLNIQGMTVITQVLGAFLVGQWIIAGIAIIFTKQDVGGSNGARNN